nr:MAG TPA: hypothetical protein [Caudoviricetes sp.]
MICIRKNFTTRQQSRHAKDIKLLRVKVLILSL